MLADPTRTPAGGYGTPGRSALAMYRRERARERAAWSGSLPRRAALVLATAAGTAILAGATGLHGAALLLATLAAGECSAGGCLPALPRHPRVARRRQGRAGHRAPAPPARAPRPHRVPRRGHPRHPRQRRPRRDLSWRVVLVDSKRYAGRVWQGADGRVWHNQHPMDQALRSLWFETAAISHALGVPARPLVCVHGAHVDMAGLSAGEVEIVPTARLRSVLTATPPLLSGADVAALVAHAQAMLRPA